MTGALIIIGATVVVIVLSIGVGSIFAYFREKELDRISDTVEKFENNNKETK